MVEITRAFLFCAYQQTHQLRGRLALLDEIRSVDNGGTGLALLADDPDILPKVFLIC